MLIMLFECVSIKDIALELISQHIAHDVSLKIPKALKKNFK